MDIKGLHLVAGQSGIARKIRWIYFADAIANLDCNFRVDEWARGEELIVLMDAELMQDKDKILNFMQKANEIRTAGIVVNINQSTKWMKAAAEDFQMPLFEMSYELHLVDLSQYICKILVEEEQKQGSLNELLLSILYDRNLSNSEIIQQGNLCGVNLAQNHRVVIFEMPSIDSSQFEREYILYKEELLYMVKRELRIYDIPQCLIRDQGNDVIVLLPSQKISDVEIRNIGETVIQDFEKRYHLPVCMSIGRAYHDPIAWKTSYEEAKEALTVAKIKKNHSQIEFFNDTGLYSLIMHVQSEKHLEAYMNRYLKPLIEADDLGDGILLETLSMYLKCDGNANATAEALFIHRNTMRYRLEKIKKILKMNLNDLDVCFKLNMALCIKQYLDYRNKEKKNG